MTDHLHDPLGSHSWQQSDALFDFTDTTLLGQQLLWVDSSATIASDGFQVVSPTQNQLPSPLIDYPDAQHHCLGNLVCANASSPPAICPVLTPDTGGILTNHSSATQGSSSRCRLNHEPHDTPATPHSSAACETGRSPVVPVGKPKRGRPRKEHSHKAFKPVHGTSSLAENMDSAHSTFQSASIAAADGGEDEDRGHTLERNRLAANKFRNRKRSETKELITDERTLEADNERLVAIHGELRSEVVRLKGLLLQHGYCDCELIRTYIDRESRSIVDRAGLGHHDSSSQLQQAWTWNEAL